MATLLKVPCHLNWRLNRWNLSCQFNNPVIALSIRPVTFWLSDHQLAERSASYGPFLLRFDGCCTKEVTCFKSYWKKCQCWETNINAYGWFCLLGEVQAPSYTGSDVPDQDVDDNENAAPPPPSAPPADMFGKFAGYEMVNFGKWVWCPKCW